MGYIPRSEWPLCPACGSDGISKVKGAEKNTPCPVCQGAGRITPRGYTEPQFRTCPTCGGAGSVNVAEVVLESGSIGEPHSVHVT